MGLRVVGAGLGRTGTHSLKLALERLLGGPCYHMIEVFGRPDDVGFWAGAVDGSRRDWDTVFEGYVAAVDWPASAFWRDVSEAYPDAVILLSTRESADVWWGSANRTILESFRRDGPSMPEWHAMVTGLFGTTFTPDVMDPDAAKAAYERHNAEVRATAPADRLVDWRPGDGWAPLCEALGVAVPDEPFPHANTTEEFRAMAGLDG